MTTYSKTHILVGEPPAKQPGDPTVCFLAFPDDGYIALEIPNSMVPKDQARMLDAEGKGGGMLLRFKSVEGFKNFMLGAMETAALVWPDIAEIWNEDETKS